MAWVERRVRKDAKAKQQVTYRVRWREPDGRARAKTFPRKVDADRYAATISADIVRGHYFDPDAGKVPFEEYALKWLAAQTFDEGTYEATELRLRLHAYPFLGPQLLSEIQPSTIQTWLRGLEGLAPTYRRVLYSNVSTVFTAAVDDKMIQQNPCAAKSVRRPKLDPKKVVPWTLERVLAVQAKLPDRFALAVVLGAGLGLRQGEIFGLSIDDLDVEKNEVSVQRQIKVRNGNKLIFGLPKGRKTRTVPLPSVVLEAISEHVSARPPRAVTLPWDKVDGPKHTANLLLTTREAGAINRNYFNPYIWRPALIAAGVELRRENGCHALRHFYASTLLDSGESIKALSEYLGHADPGFTLRTYTHLMPTSAERTRNAIDETLRVPSAPPTEPD